MEWALPRGNMGGPETWCAIGYVCFLCCWSTIQKRGAGFSITCCTCCTARGKGLFVLSFGCLLRLNNPGTANKRAAGDDRGRQRAQLPPAAGVAGGDLLKPLQHLAASLTLEALYDYMLLATSSSCKFGALPWAYRNRQDLGHGLSSGVLLVGDGFRDKPGGAV